jgi:hypothetical protein
MSDTPQPEDGDDRPQGTRDEPLMLSKAEFVEAVDSAAANTYGSYATEAPKGGGRTDWPRDYATD